MKTNKKALWWICCISAAVIVIISFTSLAIPENTSEPRWMGMPYVLWVSMLLSVLLVVLTVLGTLVHPGNRQTEKE